MRRAGPAAAIVLGLLASPGVAADPAIGVLEVATTGVSATAGDKLEQSVEETLADVGLRVVRSPEVRARLARGDHVAGCTFGPCMAAVGRLTGLERLLVARILGAGQSYSVVVSLVETRRGRLLAQVAQSCPVCTVDEAISTATLAVVELITSGEGAPADPDREAAVARARAVAAGDSAGRPRRRARRAGWTFAATGVALAAVGGALLASDHDRAGGLALGGGAGLAAAGGATLLVAGSF